MYVCMYNVYMSFPQMRHCNIAPLHQLGMYVCMYGILIMAAHLLLRESEGHESIHRFHFVVCEVDHVRLAGCCSPAHTSAAACLPERPISYIHTYIHTYTYGWLPAPLRIDCNASGGIEDIICMKFSIYHRQDRSG